MLHFQEQNLGCDLGGSQLMFQIQHSDSGFLIAGVCLIFRDSDHDDIEDKDLHCSPNIKFLICEVPIDTSFTTQNAVSVEY